VDGKPLAVDLGAQYFGPNSFLVRGAPVWPVPDIPALIIPPYRDLPATSPNLKRLNPPPASQTFNPWQPGL
jgi:hypothetical protein